MSDKKLFGRAVVGGASVPGTIRDGQFHVLDGDFFGSPKATGRVVPLSEIQLEAPVQPGKLLAVFGGFLMGDMTWRDDEPVIVAPKLVPHVSGDGGVIECPPSGRHGIFLEAEIALVVGRTCKNVTEDEAWDHIFGYTVFHDATHEAWEALGPYYSKSVDTFASMGPWIRTDLRDEQIAAGLDIVIRRNGEQVKRGTTKLRRFTPARVLAEASRELTFFPGDVITLGAFPPPPICKPGDKVELEIDEVGVLHNVIA
jgi:2-keto-4-pentenoate hydratase/2-oxohepta-3-ene-1,7-dioic acid hydratase in catechol pathway